MEKLAGDCITIRRLYKAASGTVRLEEPDREHLHKCGVCQGVLYIFIRRHAESSPDAAKKLRASA